MSDAEGPQLSLRLIETSDSCSDLASEIRSVIVGAITSMKTIEIHRVRDGMPR
jgi:hypothetical protein